MYHSREVKMVGFSILFLLKILKNAFLGKNPHGNSKYCHNRPKDYILILFNKAHEHLSTTTLSP